MFTSVAVRFDHVTESLLGKPTTNVPTTASARFPIGCRNDRSRSLANSYDSVIFMFVYFFGTTSSESENAMKATDFNTRRTQKTKPDFDIGADVVTSRNRRTMKPSFFLFCFLVNFAVNETRNQGSMHSRWSVNVT